MRDIALECYPDETLVKTLGYVRKQIYHQNSKGGVINFLKKNPGSVGIVDEDPGSANPSYMSEFEKVGESKFDLEFHRIEKENTNLIVIRPKLENWILKYARNANVTSTLPLDAKILHKVINRRIPQLEQLLTAMMTKKSPAMRYLKELIERK